MNGTLTRFEFVCDDKFWLKNKTQNALKSNCTAICWFDAATFFIIKKQMLLM